MFHIIPILRLFQINRYNCKVRYIQFFMVWTKNSGTGELFSHTLFTLSQIQAFVFPVFSALLHPGCTHSPAKVSLPTDHSIAK